MDFQGLANFLDDLMGDLALIGLCIVAGSLFWGGFVLRVQTELTRSSPAMLRRWVGLLRFGAWLLAAAQAAKLLTKATEVAATFGELPWEAYATTVQFDAGALRVALAASLAWASARLSRRPSSRMSWALVVGLTAPLVVSGAWLVHAVGRLEARGVLMTLTVIHQLAAAVWVGGVVQLLALSRLRKSDTAAARFWPIAVTRFSGLGVGAVAGLLVTGFAMATRYVPTWDSLFGTGYGSLIVAKAFLLLLALGFAAMNFFAGRRWLRDPRGTEIGTGVPLYVEAEAFLLFAIVFGAATLSSQPPAVDIPGLTASVADVLGMFAPKWPRLESPTHVALLAGEPGRVALVGRVPSLAATQWSDYNHNVSGILLAAMGLLALLSYRHGFRWARYWPLGFVALGVFLFFRSDAEAWPLGPIGFWESTFGNGEILQHRLATALTFALGIVEVRARTGGEGAKRLRFVFPVLCALGGLLLLIHAHAQFEIRSDYLIQSTHLAMGLLAILMAAGRWLELRLAQSGRARESRAAGLASVGALLLISAILVFYREPLY